MTLVLQQAPARMDGIRNSLREVVLRVVNGLIIEQTGLDLGIHALARLHRDVVERGQKDLILHLEALDLTNDRFFQTGIKDLIVFELQIAHLVRLLAEIQ